MKSDAIITAGRKAKTRSGWGALLASIVVVVGVAAFSDGAPTTRPTPQMQEAVEAYSHLKTLSDSGKIELNADVDGQQAHRSAEFVSAFGGNNHFRHEVKQDVIASCNGEKIYVFHPTDNLYTEVAAPDDGTIPDDVRRLLEAQDLSLALALSGDVSGELLLGATSAVDQADGTIHVSYADRDVTLTLDPKTHLLRQVVTDESRGLRARGANVKAATVTIRYDKTSPDAAIPADELAFTPPATADEQPAAAPTVAANDLTGKAAPNFKLVKFGGGTVSDKDLHGSVYVLDFWATWCGPCVESLPGLDAIYKQRQAAGLKVFAVNQQEEAGVVGAFIGRTKLSIPVLLDTDGKVGASFGANAIPETVVIGRDGTIRSVFVGSGNEQNIAAAADAAMAGKPAGP